MSVADDKKITRVLQESHALLHEYATRELYTKEAEGLATDATLPESWYQEHFELLCSAGGSG